MSGARVKNKAPAAVQITSEQLLREAWDNKEVSGADAAPPRHQIADAEELGEYQQTKRQEFENRIIRTRGNMSLWVRYARWEEAQRDFTRARSVFERAIDTNYRSHVVWLAYAEMEMRHKFINHARNVWDRAVTFLPRVPELWLKYAFMEEMLMNVALARLVYDRWLKWLPDISAYNAFVQFEERHGSTSHARTVYEQLVVAHPTARGFLKYAAFEEKHSCTTQARAVFERATSGTVPGLVVNAELYISFAKFEERADEPERARAIYRFATRQSLPGDGVAAVLEALTVFEKQRGERAGIEEVVIAKKRGEYEERLAVDPKDYDVWFDLIRLEESAASAEWSDKGKIQAMTRVRNAYRRAVSNTPCPDDKRFWRRYIYLWLSFAVWEELEVGDLAKAADIYRECLSVIPNKHAHFSFGKVWLLSAKLEIRRKRPEDARRLLGHALGVLPHKDSLYREYICIERSLGEIDRVRTLYRVWLERNPTSTAAFIEFATLEAGDLKEIARARDIFELGVSSPRLDQPEALWNAYIEFEQASGEVEPVRALYERLLAKAAHVKVLLAYGRFLENADDVGATRELYVRGDRMLKDRLVDMEGAPRESAAGDRVRLLDAWLAWERRVAEDVGEPSNESVAQVTALMPKRIKRRRVVTDARGADAGWEEYYEYIFPEEQAANPKLKILEAARKWAARKQHSSTAGGLGVLNGAGIAKGNV